ncbi:monocarboxylate transporter 14-like [Dermacentor albipictus]|uniref:monocarboxylate transporter 14-like n=1 Tax=Dermacentor albipictus TaxID=60249 RepID=UPI0031FCECBC
MARSEASLRSDPHFGLDSRWSWVTAAFLSWLLCGAMMAQQSAGVLFFGIVDTYGVSREEASWPLVLSSSVVCLTGPVVGYLCRRFSCQPVLLFFSLASGISVCVCYFANGVPFLTVVLGFVHGAAVSGVFVGVQVLVSQHFEKRRATACSLMFTVCGLNMFFAAPLVDLFRVTYGIKGAFLLLGGLILNACPAVIVVRNPTWMQVRDPPTVGEKDETFPKDKTSAEAPLLTLYSESRECASGEKKAVPESKTELSLPKASVGSNYARNLRNFCSILRYTASGKEAQEGVFQDVTANARRFATLRFALDALSFSVIVFGLATFFLLYVDIATDRGVVPSRAAFLVYAFAAGDLVCRALSGVVIDSGVLTLDSVMLFGYVLQAAGFELFVWLRTFPTMLVCSALIGISNGFRHSLQAPLLVRDFGIEHLPGMMGGLSFCNGLVLLSRPMLVGYYRDQQGSYDGLLHIAGAVNAAFCFLWAIRIFSERRRQWSQCGHSKQRQEELGFS